MFTSSPGLYSLGNGGKTNGYVHLQCMHVNGQPKLYMYTVKRGITKRPMAHLSLVLVYIAKRYRLKQSCVNRHIAYDMSPKVMDLTSAKRLLLFFEEPENYIIIQNLVAHNFCS